MASPSTCSVYLLWYPAGHGLDPVLQMYLSAHLFSIRGIGNIGYARIRSSFAITRLACQSPTPVLTARELSS